MAPRRISWSARTIRPERRRAAQHGSPSCRTTHALGNPLRGSHGSVRRIILEQAQGAGIHSRRRFRGRRAQARSDRANRRRHTGHRRHALAEEFLDPACQADVQHPRDPGARRGHHRHRRGDRRDSAPVCRPPDRNPCVLNAFQPLLSTIPLQVFAASLAQAQGYDVDKAATWPSPSPSKKPQRHLPLGGGDQNRHTPVKARGRCGVES